MSSPVEMLKAELEAEIKMLEGQTRRLETATEGPTAVDSATPFTDHYKRFLAEHAQRKRAAFVNSHRSAGAANGVYPAGALDWSVKRRESPADESFDDIEEATVCDHGGRAGRDGGAGFDADAKRTVTDASSRSSETEPPAGGWRRLLCAIAVVSVIALVALLLILLVIRRGSADNHAPPPDGSAESANVVNAAPEDNGGETARSQGQTTTAIVVSVVSVVVVGGCFCFWRCLLKGAVDSLNEYDSPSILPSLCREVSEVGFKATTSEGAVKVEQQAPAEEQVPTIRGAGLDRDLDLDVIMGVQGSAAAGGNKSAAM